MNTLTRFLFIFCMSMVRAEDLSANEQVDVESLTEETVTATDVLPDSDKWENVEAGRRLDTVGITNEFVDAAEQQLAFKKRAKPLKNIFLGIYKNYKSTYLGNRTSLEYKKNLRERSGLETSSEINLVEDITEVNTESATDAISLPESAVTTLSNKKRRKRKRKQQLEKSRKRSKISAPAGGDDPLISVNDNEYRYNVGPGVNMSLDMYNDVISMHLDGNNLREIMTGHWLSDNTEQGRGKKYDMMTKVLPLFVLPFLIQSAIVPFLVTKLKLLLIKSILVGKLAIFLLIISAIKNSNKMMQTYEVAPSYWASEPSRRSELAAAASSAAYNGYRVEGKPTTWIN